MKALAILAIGAVVASLPARAEEDEAAQAARWGDLRHAVFGDREVKDGSGLIALEAPPRALDAAIVPITVTVAGPQKVKTIYVVIDENPSPLAGVFHFGPAGDPHEIKTRVRVNAYTLMHAVAETEDGQLFGTATFVKASGGCSAPEPGDPQLALERLGRMQLKTVGEASPPPGVTELQLLVSHPNYNGMQMDQVTRTYTPARFIQDIKVTTGGQLVFDLESDISLSADPAITFRVVPQGTAPLDVAVRDSAGGDFKRSFDLPSRGS